jgi:hypothetical protein
VLALVLADQRVAHLVQVHGLVREYVHDYGAGRVGLAAIGNQDEVSWYGTPPP